MALFVNLRSFENLDGNLERIVTVTFRETTFQSNVVKSAKDFVYFGQSFQWPLSRPIQSDEILHFQLFNYNRYLANKLIGKFDLFLHQLAIDGEISVKDVMVDAVNRALEILINFSVNYCSPDGTVGHWTQTDNDFSFPLPLDDVSSDGNDMEDKFMGFEDVVVPDGAPTETNKGDISSALSKPDKFAKDPNKPQNFQIMITIIQGQQLAGLDIDPVIKVEVDNECHYTNICKSNNCPYYNEYFVFNFHDFSSTFFDKIITISALNAYNLPGRQILKSTNIVAHKNVIGVFKCDVGMIYAAPGHQFYHKWALLMDLKDLLAGPKGYIKCDIAVCCNGQTVKPPKIVHDTDSIESNLLLPAGLTKSRNRAIYSVNIFRAEDLTTSGAGVMANLKKVLSEKDVDLVNAFIQVSFVGHVGKTSVRRSRCPVWNEVIGFSELFPPLCNRMKIQLCDHNTFHDDILATYYIDLLQIMDSGTEGILPTFGPSWINLYGGLSNESEGNMFRGRLLLSIKTAIDNSDATGACSVFKDKINSSLSESTKLKKEFLLFSSLFEATLIEKSLNDKSVHFEINFGKYGNSLDESKPMVDTEDDDDDDPDLQHRQKELEASLPCRSYSPSNLVVMMDKYNGFVPIDEVKPCLYCVAMLDDFRKRSFNCNLLENIVTKLSESLEKIKELLKASDPGVDDLVETAVGDLLAGCHQYMRLYDKLTTSLAEGRTKLDHHRQKSTHAYIMNLEKLCLRVRKVDLDCDDFMQSSREEEKDTGVPVEYTAQRIFQELKQAKNKLQQMAKEPQNSLPDVVIWMICEKQRVAFCKLPAKDFLFSSESHFCGKMCGKRQNIFLKKSSKSGIPGEDFAMLDIFLWLGEYQPGKKTYLELLPKGFEPVHEEEDEEEKNPPISLYYPESCLFQLRSYIYQARAVIGSDSTGLSDPFVRVSINNWSNTSQIKPETLCPTWQETLIIDDIVLYGTREEILTSPPVVVIEIYDYDKIGHPEFLGRTITSPVTIDYTLKSGYEPSPLKWLNISRGGQPAGQLLASFDLIEGATDDLPSTSLILSQDNTISLPSQLSPSMSAYRLEVLFHGVRELRQSHLMSCDHPGVAIECSGHTLWSTTIADMNKNSNFERQVDYMDLELPDDLLFWPSMTVRFVDFRRFGWTVSIGICTIDHIEQFLWSPPIDDVQDGALDEEIVEGVDDNSATIMNVVTDDQTDPDGHSQSHRIGHTNLAFSSTSLNKDKGRSGGNKEGPSAQELIADLDWWTKYYVTKDDEKNRNMLDNKNDEAENLSEEDDEEFEVNVVDYSAFDWERLNDEKEEGKSVEESVSRIAQIRRGFICLWKAIVVIFLTIKNSCRKFLLERNSGSEDSFSVDEEIDDQQHIARIKMYPTELEKVPEFGGFEDVFKTFEIFHGKKLDGDDNDLDRFSGLFKGNFCLYKTDPDSSTYGSVKKKRGSIDEKVTKELKLAQRLPPHEPIEVRVVVYVVRAFDLHPVDIDGKADPYLVVRCGRQKIDDKSNKIINQLNPVFGRTFEFDAVFSVDSMLKVEVWDYDMMSNDDLIGVTSIDLENRYFSRHQAQCGIQQKYEIFGYNIWRNPLKPTELLEKLCTDYGFQCPVYQRDSVCVNGQLFCAENEDEMLISNESGECKPTNEHMALKALLNWHTMPNGIHLLPEHIETRALYCDERPGIEQGKLEMWVDMFPKDSSSNANYKVDITARNPVSYELRCIIWNTDEVSLDDVNLVTGEQSSDIFVKGYLKGVGEDDQQTDVHYNSMTGEGNFNWRFIFRFDYLKAENKVVYKKKDFILSSDTVEYKIPPQLTVQLWDADLVSADDFLGSFTLDLTKISRPSKISKNCTLDMQSNKRGPTVNLFKSKHVRGWWAAGTREEIREEEKEDKKKKKKKKSKKKKKQNGKDENDGSSTQLVLKGKVEIELQLLTADEADKSPVGGGRENPDGLPEPNRPDTSFMWFMNPLKALRYIIWKAYKWLILKLLLLSLLIMFLLIFFYNVPGAIVNKIFAAF